MLRVDPDTATVQEVHRLLLGGVAPRPIALVSTSSKSGAPNLSPFSFFNAFGANPPVVAFSPARRGRDGSLKDTYRNLMETGECVIQAVTEQMVEQVSLASTEYPPGVNEFAKSGLTPLPSELVKPFRVKESPFQMECKLMQMIPLGEDRASGNLAICRVLRFHVDESLFTNGTIDPRKSKLVARMGGDYYTRSSGSEVFLLRKPVDSIGIGYDMLPPYIRLSSGYSGNHIAKLANSETLPAEREIMEFYHANASPPVPGEHGLRASLKQLLGGEAPVTKTALEQLTMLALSENEIQFALYTAMLVGFLRLEE